MGIYVQEASSQLILTFKGPWASPFTTPVDIVRDNRLVALLLPQTLRAGSVSSPITCQLPGDLAPKNNVHIIGNGNNGVSGTASSFVIDPNALLTIYAGVNFEPFSGSSPNGFYGTDLIWFTKQ